MRRRSGVAAHRRSRRIAVIAEGGQCPRPRMRQWRPGFHHDSGGVAGFEILDRRGVGGGIELPAGLCRYDEQSPRSPHIGREDRQVERYGAAVVVTNIVGDQDETPRRTLLRGWPPSGTQHLDFEPVATCREKRRPNVFRHIIEQVVRQVSEAYPGCRVRHVGSFSTPPPVQKRADILNLFDNATLSA
ncbi:hypothetical protein DF3PB_6150003 [uncultured Defluviicoccus sp.]|uniref:Uncharacterized protein n=1 Tax=metagenome TaxID=256318 RepID=A0A380TJT6_9ZZZZ|nr:hypothetical protein DF3PB_6150003 [uncultured Defluviicoccus sp.]